MFFLRSLTHRTYSRNATSKKAAKCGSRRRESQKLFLEPLEDRFAPATLATMVADIGQALPDPQPALLTAVNIPAVTNALYFNVNDGTRTAMGIYDGSSFMKVPVGTGPDSPNQFTAVGNSVFFAASDGAAQELWNYNLSSGAVTEIGGLSASALYYNPSGLTPVNDRFLFFSAVGDQGQQLWQYDSSNNSLSDVTGPLGLQAPEDLTAMNGKVYFSQNYGDDPDDNGLWEYAPNGTPTLIPGSKGTAPSDLTPVNGDLYFKGYNGTGFSLYKYHPFALGSTLAPVTIGTNSNPNPQSLTADTTNDTVFFNALDASLVNRQLWKYHAGDPGATEIPDVGSFANPDPANLTMLDGTLYFSAYIAGTIDHSANPNNQLFKYSGTTPTQLTGNALGDPVQLYPRNLTAAGSDVYFTGLDNNSFEDLWRYDGTSAPAQVALGTGAAPQSSPQDLATLGSTLYLTVTDTDQNQQLWMVSGGSAQRVPLMDSSAPSSPASFVAGSDGNVYFSASDGVEGSQLWRTDGTSAGTHAFSDLNPYLGMNPQFLTQAGTVVYFTGFDGSKNALFQLFEGLPLPLAFHEITAAGNPQNLTGVGSDFYFTGTDTGLNTQLWQVIGGNAQVIDLTAVGGNANPDPQNLTAFGGKLCFTALDASGFRQLWVYDGTSVNEITTQGANDPNPQELTVVGGMLYFTATDSSPDGVTQLWLYDGNSAFTATQLTVNSQSSPSQLTAVNGSLYYTDTDSSGDITLWQYTIGGPIAPFEIPGLPGPYSPSEITLAGTTLYFAAYESPLRLGGGFGGGTGGGFGGGPGGGIGFGPPDPQLLWSYDLNSPLTPPSQVNGAPASPLELTAAGSTLYFTDPSGQLWQYSGSGIATTISINPSGASKAANLAFVNGKLYLSADDGACMGAEPWIVNPTAPPSVAVSGSGTLSAINLTPLTQSDLAGLGAQGVVPALPYSIGFTIDNVPPGLLGQGGTVTVVIEVAIADVDAAAGGIHLRGRQVQPRTRAGTPSRGAAFDSVSVPGFLTITRYLDRRRRPGDSGGVDGEIIDPTLPTILKTDAPSREVTSPDNATFTVGNASSFTVTTNWGFPAPVKLSREAARLPMASISWTRAMAQLT